MRGTGASARPMVESPRLETSTPQLPPIDVTGSGPEIVEVASDYQLSARSASSEHEPLVEEPDEHSDVSAEDDVTAQR